MYGASSAGMAFRTRWQSIGGMIVGAEDGVGGGLVGGGLVGGDPVVARPVGARGLVGWLARCVPRGRRGLVGGGAGRRGRGARRGARRGGRGRGRCGGRPGSRRGGGRGGLRQRGPLRRRHHAGDRERHVARDEVAAGQLELAAGALEAAGDLARQVEVADLVLGDQRMADVEAGQMEAARELRAEPVDIEVQPGIDRGLGVVDDGRVLEDRRESIELELGRLELDRRGQGLGVEAALGGPQPARHAAVPAGEVDHVLAGMPGVRDDVAGDPRQRELGPQRDLAAADRDVRRAAGDPLDVDRRGRGLRRVERGRGDPAGMRDQPVLCPPRVGIGDERRRAGQLVVGEQLGVRHRDRRGPQAEPAACSAAAVLAAQPLDHIVHVVLTVGLAADRHQQAVDPNGAELDRADQRSPAGELDVDAVDVDQRGVAVARPADLDVAHHGVADRDVDRADPDIAAQPRRQLAAEPRSDYRRADPGIVHRQADRRTQHHPEAGRAGDQPAPRQPRDPHTARIQQRAGPDDSPDVRCG
ncbi:MAG: hypothetical protein E6J91_10175 [Deltaproteobacteria bacterium]|nr:MAG: hypothetical protein E6J91_10175 [Deltaproteobacteria bacterium]